MVLKHKRILSTLFLLLVAVALLWLPNRADTRYFRNEGRVFGTTYNIQYEAGKDWHDSIRIVLQEVDNALSMFNTESVLSRINRGEEVTTTPDFEEVFLAAQEVSRSSNGAFDITVAPLVNAWGFGFKNREKMTQEMVDSLLPLIGYEGLALENHRLHKSRPQQQLDAGAVAKGFGCDKVARFLRTHGVENLLVEIGGEVVAEGQNSKGDKWAIGISKPIDDTSGEIRELQEVIRSSHLCMATSGNYRNFYYDGDERRSHTINPHTGYPVQHSLLSATVTASSCMRADALATCCMVLGTDSALALIERMPDAECLLIEASGDSTLVTRTSSGWEQ